MTTITRHRRGPVEQVADGLHRIRLGIVNAYLLEADHGMVLIDCGEPGRADHVAEAVRHLGRVVEEIGHVVVTHHHFDHIGSLAEMVRRSGAQVHAHAADAAFVRGDRVWDGFRRDVLLGRILGPVQRRFAKRPEAVAVDGLLDDGQTLTFAGGLQALHTPGHTLGHMSFLLPRDGGVLITGDAAINIAGLRSGGHRIAAMVCDDLAAADASFRRLATLDFEIAAFGHGPPLRSGAADRFRQLAAR